jgi:hypothetical protein
MMQVMEQEFADTLKELQERHEKEFKDLEEQYGNKMRAEIARWVGDGGNVMIEGVEDWLWACPVDRSACLSHVRLRGLCFLLEA